MSLLRTLGNDRVTVNPLKSHGAKQPPWPATDWGRFFLTVQPLPELAVFHSPTFHLFWISVITSQVWSMFLDASPTQHHLPVSLGWLCITKKWSPKNINSSQFCSILKTYGGASEIRITSWKPINRWSTSHSLGWNNPSQIGGLSDFAGPSTACFKALFSGSSSSIRDLSISTNDLSYPIYSTT